MFKRRTEEQQKESDSNNSRTASSTDDPQQEQSHPLEDNNSNNNNNNNSNMFQRLFKRFKRNHHTPPTSPSTAAASTTKTVEYEKNVGVVGETQEIQPQQQTGEKGHNDDDNATNGEDNESVSSHSSSYSDYDYLEPSRNSSQLQSVDNDDDVGSGENFSASYDDDDDDDSSYSDYDDYQYLTAVSMAAAARNNSIRVVKDNDKQQEGQESEKNAAATGPPTTITTVSNDQQLEEDEEDGPQPPISKTTKNENSSITPVELEALARTAFPDFFCDSEQGVPGAILSDGTESSSDEEDAATIRRKTEKYRTKEDEDVAVFMNLAKRMSLKSLLHLLKGHVQSQRDQYSVEYMKQYNNALKHYRSKSSSSDFSSTSLSSILSTDGDGGDDDDDNKKLSRLQKQSPAEEASQEQDSPRQRRRRRKQRQSLRKTKQFRWAEVTNDKVRTVVHEIESIKSCMDLWWQPGEMHTIRADLVETVKFYRKRRPGYIQSVEIVARHSGELGMSRPNTSTSTPSVSSPIQDPSGVSTQQSENAISACINHQQQILEDNMKSLMSAEYSYARGLETHIVKMLSDHRKATVLAVMDEQRECKMCNDDYDTTTHCLREQSIAYSNMSTKFAFAMARCDQIEGLKASMSTWMQE